jgi:hypothetical protein
VSVPLDGVVSSAIDGGPASSAPPLIPLSTLLSPPSPPLPVSSPSPVPSTLGGGRFSAGGFGSEDAHSGKLGFSTHGSNISAAGGRLKF